MKFTKEDFQKILNDTAIIFGITLIAGLLLGFVYELTKTPIANQELKAQADACSGQADRLRQTILGCTFSHQR